MISAGIHIDHASIPTESCFNASVTHLQRLMRLNVVKFSSKQKFKMTVTCFPSRLNLELVPFCDSVHDMHYHALYFLCQPYQQEVEGVWSYNVLRGVHIRDQYVQPSVITSYRVLHRHFVFSSSGLCFGSLWSVLWCVNCHGNTRRTMGADGYNFTSRVINVAT